MIKILLPVFLLLACKSQPETIQGDVRMGEQISEIKSDSLLVNRFLPPTGYSRVELDSNSFAFFLRHLKLKPSDAKVELFTGELKVNQDVHAAVVDYDVGTRDLQQCADAVMRIRGEYQFAQNDFKNIAFNFVSDGKPRYFLEHSGGKNDYASFRSYLNYVFSYANTRSLYYQMNAVSNYGDLQNGDVFIQTGNPYGHAVIVVDVAINKAGEKVFMVAQSYMPAQSIHILKNPINSDISPWYRLNEGAEIIVTPEWIFQQVDLRRF